MKEIDDIMFLWYVAVHNWPYPRPGRIFRVFYTEKGMQLKQIMDNQFAFVCRPLSSQFGRIERVESFLLFLHISNFDPKQPQNDPKTTPKRPNISNSFGELIYSHPSTCSVLRTFSPRGSKEIYLASTRGVMLTSNINSKTRSTIGFQIKP